MEDTSEEEVEEGENIERQPLNGDRAIDSEADEEEISDIMELTLDRLVHHGGSGQQALGQGLSRKLLAAEEESNTSDPIPIPSSTILKNLSKQSQCLLPSNRKLPRRKGPRNP
jgi:hypothetical protein